MDLFCISYRGYYISRFFFVFPVWQPLILVVVMNLLTRVYYTPYSVLHSHLLEFTMPGAVLHAYLPEFNIRCSVTECSSICRSHTSERLAIWISAMNMFGNIRMDI
jgi:hypothetical protein